MAKMIILDTKCKEDLKWSLCEEEKLFSGENVNEKYKENRVIVASFLKLCDKQNFGFLHGI